MKLAVHVHLFYVEMYKEIKKYLDNLSFYRCDLFFTVTEKDFRLKKKIEKDFYNYNVRVIETENVGFDVYPFLLFLDIINLDEYDLIVKIHTKKNIPFDHNLNGYDLSGNAWRSYLLTAILGSKNRVKDILKSFKKNSNIGMIGAKELIIRGDIIKQYIDIEKVKAILQNFEQPISKKEFIAGTIFIARACLFKALKNRKYTIKDFPPYYPQDWNSLPYCLERYFGFMVSSQGYKLLGLSTPGVKGGSITKLTIFKNLTRLLFKKSYNLILRSS